MEWNEITLGFHFNYIFKFYVYMGFSNILFGAKLAHGKLQNETMDIINLNDKIKIEIKNNWHFLKIEFYMFFIKEYRIL